MASSITKPAPCLMCLEAPAVCKVDDECQHAFCESCLSSYHNDNDTGGPNHFLSKRQRQGNLPCPACKGHCSQTTVQTDNDCGEDTDEQAKESGEEKPGDLTSTYKHPVCKICFHRGKTVRATKACNDCRNIPMCPSCLQTHRDKPETKHHVTGNMVLLNPKEQCVAHGEPLDVWCKDCAVHICSVCVPLDHSDHQIEPLTDVIRKEPIQTALEFEQGRLVRLQGDETYLQESKAKAQDMKDTLIKAIEDHTEKVIKEALTNKETLKKEVRSTFMVIGVLAKWLDDMPKLLNVSKGIIERAERVLNENAELNSVYVENIRCLKQDLEVLKNGEADYTKEKDTYRGAYKKLCEGTMRFYPRSPNMNIRALKDPGPKCDAGGSCVCETCKKCFKFPHINRVGECRNWGFCACDTCGSRFNRSELDERGCCKICRKGSVLNFIAAAGYYNQ